MVMDEKLAGRLLDRIADLSRGKEHRLEEYLSMKTRTAQAGHERQKAMRDRKQASGMKRAEVWIDPADMETLREKYPGQRGGIDWQAVIRAAIGE